MISGVDRFSFDNTPLKVSGTAWKKFAQCPRLMKKCKSFRKKNFPKILLCRGRMAFLQSSRKLFGRKPEMFCSMFQKDVKDMFFFERRIFIWKCSYGFYGHIDFKFESYAEKTLTKGQKSFAQCPETIRNKKVRKFFSGLIF